MWCGRCWGKRGGKRGAFGSSGRRGIWVGRVGTRVHGIISEDTDLLSPHLLRHAQWKVCEQGTVTSPVTAASMRSRHTGQVGSSYAPETGVGTIREIDSEIGSSTSIAMESTRTT